MNAFFSSGTHKNVDHILEPHKSKCFPKKRGFLHMYLSPL